MPFPTITDYRDAVANYLHICLQGDSELKNGKPKRAADDTRYVMSMSGNFAVVFAIQSGNKTYAVRFFTRNIQDIGTRYQAISNHLKTLPPSLAQHFVKFEYKEGATNGVFINRQRHPYIKMEWVDGQNLKEYVEILRKNRSQKALSKLSQQWFAVVSGMQKYRLAHGDLQPGNILISKGQQIRLVDYDGVYVPALQGLDSVGLGIPGYQHPKRQIQDFDENLDNFAAMAIYLTLMALTVNPDLQFGTVNEEEILFTSSDWLDPANSKALKVLGKSPNPLVSYLALKLKESCSGEYNAIPIFRDLYDVLEWNEIMISAPGGTSGVGKGKKILWWSIFGIAIAMLIVWYVIHNGQRNEGGKPMVQESVRLDTSMGKGQGNLDSLSRENRELKEKIQGMTTSNQRLQEELRGINADNQKLKEQLQGLTRKVEQKEKEEADIARKKQELVDKEQRQRQELAEKELARREEEEKKKTDASYSLPLALWNACMYQHEGEPILDMTTDTWCNLSVSEQRNWATTYQAAYARVKGLELSKTITQGEATFVMRLIPPGRFWMGSTNEEAERDSDETRHRVVISRPYYMAKTEVTQSQWQAIMNANPSYFQKVALQKKLEDVSWEDFDEWVNARDYPKFAPVERISWEDCQAFCGKTGLIMPTEAQWEYACRAGVTRTFNLGENISPDQVNYDGNYPYAKGIPGSYRHTTVATGTLPNANAWGIHDMHGNLWEWCQDWKGEYPQADAIDPQGAQSGTDRVNRGGSWFDGAKNCRSADRRGDSSDSREFYLGFRPCWQDQKMETKPH